MAQKPYFNQLRDLDQVVEQETAKYLDKYYYSWFKDFKRISDKNEQLKGKDVILSSSKYGFTDAIIDEKTASHYVSFGKYSTLPTFAFELSFIRKSGDWTLGWLLDSDKDTQYYLLTWPFVKKDNCIEYFFKRKDGTENPKPYYLYRCEDIIKLEYALISRDKLLNYLSKKGFTQDRLLHDEKDVRNKAGDEKWMNDFKSSIEKEIGGNFSESPRTGFYYTYTDSLDEKPVNLVIYKNTLKEIAEKFSIILPNNED